jgi:hypothetical protein
MVVAVGRQHANPANRQKWQPGDFGGNNPVSHDRGRSSTAGNAQAPATAPGRMFSGPLVVRWHGQRASFPLCPEAAQVHSGVSRRILE